jgi:serine/threonine-protein kinase HipA
VRDLRRVTTADVYKKDRLAGVLRRNGEEVSFAYDEAYLSSSAPPIATTLPLSTVPVTRVAGAVPPFFAGLLPEGVRLSALIRQHKTSADDELTLLIAVGSDTIGDVRIVPSGTRPTAVSDEIDIEDEHANFDALFAAAVSPQSPRVSRTALAGVQVKISAGRITLPTGSGRWILKLQPLEYPNIVENEAFFMRLASKAGISVAETRVVHDMNGRSALLVRRFDRSDVEGRVMRRAQEDACQLANRYPADKYLLSAREVCEAILNVSAIPRIDALRLVVAFAFSYAIGNGDLHAKNLSVGEDGEGLLRLTPMYDLVSTIVYIGNDRQALSVDGRDDNFRREHFIAFASRLGVAERAIASSLNRLCTAVLEGANTVEAIGLDERTTRRLAKVMRERAARLLEPASARY